MKGREKSRGLSLGKRRKRGKERRYGWGGMKGNSENVGEDKRKEERNDGRKVCTLTESTPVLTGEYYSTYVRVLERISLKRCSL